MHMCLGSEWMLALQHNFSTCPRSAVLDKQPDVQKCVYNFRIEPTLNEVFCLACVRTKLCGMTQVLRWAPLLERLELLLFDRMAQEAVTALCGWLTSVKLVSDDHSHHLLDVHRA